MSRAVRPLRVIRLVLSPKPAGVVECVDFLRMHSLLRRTGAVCHGAVQSEYRGHSPVVLERGGNDVGLAIAVDSPSLPLHVSFMGKQSPHEA